MLCFLITAWDAPITGATTVYTDVSLNEELAQADSFFLAARASQVSGTTNLAVAIEHSNDGVNWTNKSSPIPSTLVSGVQFVLGQDTGSTPGGGFHRLAITLSGTTPSAHVQITVAGRTAEGPQRILYSTKIWEGSISGATTIYTDPALGAALATAD